MAKTIEKQIEQLRKEIKKLNDYYYAHAETKISDFEYDKKLQELERLENENPHLITPDSPTQKVGSDLVPGAKLVKHKFPMLSIENKKDLIKFDESIKRKLPNKTAHIEYVVEPKIDGVSISLEYENGKLKTAATRGDGEYGEDVTENVRTINSIPKTIIKSESIAYNLNNIIVRGEIYISIKDFERIIKEQKEKDLKTFANPRNLAAGVIKVKNSEDAAKRPLSNFIYSLLSTSEIFDSQGECLEILSTLGFQVNSHTKKCLGIQKVIDACTKLEEIRYELPFEIDGAVIKVNSIKLQNILGIGTKYPNWSGAFKFPPPQVITKIKDIVWQVGRTGAVTPVAELEPKFLAGSTISRATLHNYDEIKRLDVRIDDQVVLEKGGDVIPKIVKVIKVKGKKRKAKTLPPEYCPICQSKLIKVEDKVSLNCKNPQCPGKLNNLIQHFVSRAALDIKGIGESVTDNLIEKKIINSVFDIFDLDVDNLASLNLGTENKPRLFGEKNAKKIINGIEIARSKPFSKWLFALGIPKLGIVGAKSIAEKHNTIEEIKNSPILKDIIRLKELTDQAIQSNPRAKINKSKFEKGKLELKHSNICNQIEEVGKRLVDIGWYKQIQKRSKTKVRLIPEFKLIGNKSVGVEVAKSIIDFLNTSVGKEVLNRMKEFEKRLKGTEKVLDLLDGKVFVLTGTLPTMKREEAMELIEKNGGKVTGKVSKNTDFLLAGAQPGSKYEDAKRLGIKIISEEQFLDTIANDRKTKKKNTSMKFGTEQLDIFS